MAKRIPGTRADYIKVVNGQKRKFIEIDGIEYPAEEIAWFYVTGEWPKGRILFRNGDPLDLRWKNLVEESA